MIDIGTDVNCDVTARRCGTSATVTYMAASAHYRVLAGDRLQQL